MGIRYIVVEFVPEERAGDVVAPPPKVKTYLNLSHAVAYADGCVNGASVWQANSDLNVTPVAEVLVDLIHSFYRQVALKREGPCT